MTDYLEEECTINVCTKTKTKSYRCPECKNHGDNIATRGDCKNTIDLHGGLMGQCCCYSKEHKA